jgi:hypothetical protein
MTLEVGQDIGGIGQGIALATPAPEEVVATPERSRDTDDRDALLEGMAPPAKRSGGGSVGVPGDSP